MLTRGGRPAVLLRSVRRRSGSVFSRCNNKETFVPMRVRVPIASLQARTFTAAAASERTKLPDSADVVVVGGGIIGCSTAYHLAKMGVKNVVLLERDQLTSGTTWHAAGLMVTFGSLSETSTELRKYTKKLYQSLEAETGQSTGFNPCGFIEMASCPDRLEEFRRIAAFNRKCGVDVQEITPERIKELFPLCRVDDILAGFYVADDGRVNPVDACTALAKGARMHGARLLERVQVTGVTQADGRVTGVSTTQGVIKTPKVVSCTGMWARQFGELCGVSVANQAAEHYYLITDPMEKVDPAWPVIEDPDSHTYIRPEAGGLMVGLFEPQAAMWNLERIPDDFSFGEITPDWERMTPFVEKAMSRVPATLDAGCKTFFCGPESFTPDLAPIVGEAPELEGYFVAAGLNSIGILTGGGIGRLMAHWVVNGYPDMDVTGMNIDRLHKFQTTQAYRGERVEEALGLTYKCHYPTFSNESARNVKKSPIHQQLAAKGAFFKEVSGWEGTDWFAPEGVEPKVEKLVWGRHNWFPYWEAEHRACREGVVLIDMSFMSKFLVQGRDAGKSLNYLSTANVDGNCGVITYTQWLDERGKMQADLTVLKLAEDKFLVIATDTAHRHVETHMKRNFPKDAHAFVTDVTGAYAQINLQGPRSRELLASLTHYDVSNEAYPFRTAREIDIGFCKVTCSRITYVGELGYELLIPTEQATHVYERILDKAPEFGLRHAGLKALGSLRMEKGYRDYGHDMDNTDQFLEVGLGFTADYQKPGGFIGKDKVLELKKLGVAGLSQRLAQVLCLDPQAMMYHGEVVWRNGERVGDIRAASYGHTLGGAVGLSMLSKDATAGKWKQFVSEGTWEVEIAAQKYPCRVSLSPMYDPNNARIRG